MKNPKTFDQEKISLNLAKLKKGSEHFEVIINPDKIIEYKKNPNMDVREVILFEKIFSDAKKALEASHEKMKSIFGTDDALKVAKIILNEGEIQFTQEYRDQKRKEKRNRIIDIIVRNAIDPRTGLPHPRIRIESAMEEAKVRIDDLKEAEDQVNAIVSALKPILPIKLSTKEIELKIPSQFGAKAYPVVERFGKIVSDNWLNDGSWLCVVEIPAGLQTELFDALNKLTKGDFDSRVVREK
ncbi:MAG: ribosome assembly factor SBDS [Candidatus Woesearchaeota archaeon]